MRRLFATMLVTVPALLAGQSGAAAKPYPSPPRSLGEADEVALAVTAAPSEVSANADGVRIGQWSPHLMLMLPGVSPDQLGLAKDSKVDIIQIHDRAGSHAELIVRVPKWSDGTPMKP